MNKHTFIVNTENVNEYGYRILTDGIDIEQYNKNPIVLYGHRRAYDDPGKVVGRAQLRKEKNILYADVEFDLESEFSKEVAGKVERGFIRMSSLYADILETSLDPEYLLPNQTLETVTKCKMIELSIVDVGGNDEALKLSRNGSPIKLRKVINEINHTIMSLKTIALALSMSATADENSVLNGVIQLKSDKDAAEARATKAENELKEIKDSEAESIIAEAVELGLIPDGLKTIQLSALKSDYAVQKPVFAKLIADAKAELAKDDKQTTVSTIVLGADKSKNKNTADNEHCYDYLQKHDPVELSRIHKEEPAKYAELAKAYGEGKRYIKN
ncbi:MAG: HK97 family phage prohead protease [Empedobacter falsenii]